jgi:hypothetical protein
MSRFEVESALLGYLYTKNIFSRVIHGTASCSAHCPLYRAKVAVILYSSRAFPREHLEFKPLTTVYVLPVHTL